MKKLPRQERLKELFSYDKETGVVTRKTSVSQCKAGDIVGTENGVGYLVAFVDGVQYRLHRLIWKMVTGYDPQEIDHMNGERADNRMDNMRSVSKTVNRKNRAVPKNNKSGVLGVSFDKHNNKWVARIRTSTGYKNLGRFSSICEAREARKEADKTYGYHANHGRL